MPEQYPDIARALKQMRARATSYKLLADYYDGNHRLAFATDKFRSAFGVLFRAFADNLCPSVVDAVADRLSVTGFTIEHGPEDAAAAAWALWKANRMDRRAGEVHTEALRSGDAYVIVWPDRDGKPTIYPNDGAAMTVGYDPEMPGAILWAAKAWVIDDGRLRLTLYYPDRIEKYGTASKAQEIPETATAFTPFEIEGEPWPLPNPWLQVPVFHFGNNAGVGRFGRSELVDVIPLQDALNKAIADMLVAMEFVALPQRWATGLEVDIDEATGRPKAPFIPGADRVWTVGDPDTKFGQFAPADLAQFLEVQKGFRQEIATVSRTPIHALIPPTGNWPSGESLKTSESPFLAKIADRQIAFGDGWEDVILFALRIAGGPDAQLVTEWKDASPRGELDALNALLLKEQLGASRRQLLGEAGYTAEEIDRMVEERGAEQQEMGEAMLRQFERGNQTA